MTVVEQNWEGKYCSKRSNVSVSGIWGVIRPDFVTTPSNSGANAPTVANLSIDDVHCKIGEEFTFTLSADAACDFYLSIRDADSGEYIIQGEQASSTYKNSFQRAGHYFAWMTAVNSSGDKDSNFVDFWVFGPPPTSATFTANKTEIPLGETVTLTTSTNAYYVRIAIAMFLYNDTNNGTKVCEGEIPYSYQFSPTQNGRYTGYVTAWTHEGGADSNWVTIYVGKYSVNYDANGGSGAPSAQTKYYGKDISLSSTKPTRSKYNFLGWATSPTATVAQYQPGGSFVRNENTTLYAVWQHVCSNGHNYSYKATKNPTTSATGTITGTCSKCSGTTSVTLPKLNTTDYNYKVTKAATCTADGTGQYTWKTTTYGTYSFNVILSKTGHSFSYKATKNPTTSATGTITGTCSKCSGTTSVTLPKLNTTDYNYKVTKAATCTADGTGQYTWKTTTYGTYSFNVTLSKTGHSYSYKVTKNPTTSATGTLTSTCSKCSDTVTVTLPMLNTTDYEFSELAAPTCTEDGVGSYLWKNETYGIYQFYAIIDAEGHTDDDQDGQCDNCEILFSLGDLDLDGDVDAEDLTILARHVAGIEVLTDVTALTNADVDGSGEITAEDLTLHARYVAGIITDWDQQ